MTPVDLVISARWIVPVEPQHTLLHDHALVVHDGRIVALLPTEEAHRHYRPELVHALDRHVLIPGLVNAHTHASMTLFRGLADDLTLMEWLNAHVWPAEKRWVSEAFVRDGTRLAVAEMIRGGTTCFNDMYFFPDETARVAEDAGIRAVVGLIVLDFPSVWAGDADEYLAKGTAVHDEFRNSPLVTTAFAPHAPYTVSDGPLQRVQTLAEELDCPVHMHVHETGQEVSDSVRKLGERPLARLERLGLLSPRLVAVHVTQVEETEIEAMARAGVHAVHCPESNLKLASGFCPVARMLDLGVNVAIGTDGAASNNDLDMLGELRTAALLAKGVAGSASVVPAASVLRAATLGGAQALGLDDLVGSLEPGKAADVVAVDLGGVHTQPVYDPLSQLVYAGGREQVTDVWVAGRHLLRDGTLLTIDEAEPLARAREWGERIGGGPGGFRGPPGV